MADRPDHSPLASPVLRLMREWLVPIAELTIRIAVIFLAAELFLVVPLPLDGTPLTLIHAVVALGAVVLIGISIFDSLFYDRYQP